MRCQRVPHTALVRLLIAASTATAASSLVLWGSLSNPGANETSRAHWRAPRQVAIVRFEQSPCADQSFVGTCFIQKRCIAIGGSPRGSCAMGFGVCCIIIRTGRSSQSMFNNTLFLSPDQNQGGVEGGTYQLTVFKVSERISQMRLLFRTFSINGPSMQTTCDSDRFFVFTNAAPQPPTVCGSNTNQHMYVKVGAQGDSAIVLKFEIQGPAAAGVNRRWDILVSQNAVGTLHSAPPGCLQYFSGVSGRFQSFNWDGNPKIHLANQNYVICVRSDAGFCSVCLTQCVAPPDGFSVSGLNPNALNNGGTVVNNAMNCMADFLTILCGSPMAMEDGPCAAERFCGGTLQNVMRAQNAVPNPVCTNKRPYEFRFITDAMEVAGENRAGFCIDYAQNRC